MIEWWDDLLRRDGPLIWDGHVEVPEESGLAVEPDESVVDGHLLPGTSGF